MIASVLYWVRVTGRSSTGFPIPLTLAACCPDRLFSLPQLPDSFLAGSQSGGDGGTATRVMGTFPSWMPEKQSPVFVVATANDVTKLPAELLRKGRWDELFFVDLPVPAEREAIWRLQITKHGRDPEEFDLRQLARASDGLTGSEIEAVFVEALYQGFDEGKEPADLTVAQALTGLVPLSRTMAEAVSGLRVWAKGGRDRRPRQ